VLPQCPLFAPDDRSTVCGDFPYSVGGALAHQHPMGRVNASALLVAGQSGGSRYEPCLQTAEQQGLSPEVLGVEGGRGHR
jgi:hypothetical protein